MKNKAAITAIAITSTIIGIGYVYGMQSINNNTRSNIEPEYIPTAAEINEQCKKENLPKEDCTELQDQWNDWRPE